MIFEKHDRRNSFLSQKDLQILFICDETYMYFFLSRKEDGWIFKTFLPSLKNRSEEAWKGMCFVFWG